ncbi:hypothetical protein ASC94_16170 [Massilia sp. Root418]|uniref:TorF family putative porin n=1 Tax=Massilia sp. Root418 TaxID=1736532 RepID=UPI0006FFDB75|nr:TorF family putative porin [Massilia sp. Root418]KQW91333.1 hypothetical protein ASC94_16170 [Massilia sp. Root418]
MNYMTKHLTLAAAITLAMATLGAGAARAEDAPAAKPDNEVSFNAALTTDYRYRGISQTRLKPALQGGADWTHNPSGFYAGTWLSTIKWIDDAGGDAKVEWDVYGGKRGDLGGGFSYDVGGLYYFYPSNDLHPSANTFELYGAVSYGPATLKYSHSTTNLFGFADSKNSGYFDASVNQEIQDGYILNLHVGRQNVKNNSAFSYTDWKVGVTKDYGVVTVSLAAVKATTDVYTSPRNGKDLAKMGAVLTVSKIF